jgi:5-methylcytosine-specific restriction endonuclease McrA
MSKKRSGAYRRRRYKFIKLMLKLFNTLTCGYCGAECSLTSEPISTQATVDHYIPKSKGGSCTFQNYVVCCRSCNNKKGNKIWGLSQKKLLDPSSIRK